MSGKACIVLNAPDVGTLDIAAIAQGAELIIAADGAVRHLPEDFAPHVICGDFDSIKHAGALTRFPSSEYVQLDCQETNDFEKCLDLAIARGMNEILVGANLTGRIDHALVILSVLERYHRMVAIVLHDGMMTCRVLSSEGGKECSYYPGDVACGDTISLVPRGDGASVTITGVEWPLNAETLTAGSRGLSNKAASESVSVTVHKGVLFFIHGSAGCMSTV
jgi:thiamine pyrophosphokinase